jgi:hypothetical protein
MLFSNNLFQSSGYNLTSVSNCSKAGESLLPIEPKMGCFLDKACKQQIVSRKTAVPAGNAGSL